MTGAKEVNELLDCLDSSDYRWIDPSTITVNEWVRMKCRYGCALYGNRAMCPPSVPAISACRDFFQEYTKAVILHFKYRINEPVMTTNNKFLNNWYRKINTKLFELERDVFFMNYYKAFALVIGPCVYCSECRKKKEQCLDPVRVRPTPECLGVDVFSLASKCGFNIRTLKNYNDQINSFALLLVE